MLRVFNHWFSARKFGFFVVEATAIGMGGLAGAAAGAMASAPSGRAFTLPASVATLGILAVAFASLFQFALGIMVIPGVLPPGALLGGALGAIAGALVARGAVANLFAEPMKLVIVGNGQRARAVANAIADQGDELFELVAMIDPKTI